MPKVKITKHSGDIVAFNRDKLRNSLLRSGAPSDAIEQVLQTIESRLYDGMPTRHIYKMAGKLLKKVSASHAARYNLRSAIQQLGPAGFFFEKFMARLFEDEGFAARTNLILAGKCVTHEIDIGLKKDAGLSIVECKFHAHREGNCDVKVPLYVLSRFNDLKEKPHAVFTAADSISRCMIVTNTRFTSDAKSFAACSGLDLLSWDFPAGGSLRARIDNGRLYPVTCLTTLAALEKEKLLIAGIILVRELTGSPEILDKIGISFNRRKNVLKEAQGLINDLL